MSAGSAPGLGPEAGGADDFVGRDAALHTLVTALQAAAAGRGVVAFVAGEPGIGKTRLVDEATRRTRMRVLWATCWEGDGAPALWPWHQLLRALGDGAAGADATSPAVTLALDAMTSDRASADTGAEARFALFDAVANAFADASRDDPLVLVVDDLHWADAGSIRLLHFLGRDPRARRLAIAAMYRDADLEANRPLADVVGDLAGEGIHLRLDGLDESGVAALARAIGGDDRIVTGVAMLHRRSGGNPFFVRELVRLLETERQTRGPSALPRVVPAGVHAVVARRLSGLSPRTRAVLEAAAVIGAEFEIAVLAAVVGGPGDDVLGALDEAAAAQLLVGEPGGSRAAFAHALVQEVLYERLSSAARVRLHSRVADVLEQRHGETRIPEIAHHVVRASTDGADDRAVTWAVRAADHHLARLAYEQAAGWYGRALELLRPGDGEREGELLLRRGDAAVAAGDLPSAREAFRQVAVVARERGDVDQLARAALGLGTGPGGFEVPLHDDVQIALLEESLAVLDPRSVTRVWVLARLSVALSLTGDEPRRRALSEEAITTARLVGDPSALGYALAAHCDVIAGPDWSETRRDEAAEVVRLGRQLADRQLELLGLRLRIVALLEMGDIAAADREATSFGLVSETLNQPLYRWYVPLWRGMRALMRRDLDEAKRLGSLAEEIGALAHSDNAAVLTLTQRWVRTRYEGRFADAGAELADILGLAPGGTPMVAGDAIVRLRAMIAAQLGDMDQAALHLRQWLDEGLHERAHDSEWLPETAQLAEVAALVGDREAAAVLLDQLTPYAHRFCVEGIGAAFTGSVTWFLAMLAHTVERETDADAFAREAHDSHRRVGLVGDPPALALPGASRVPRGMPAGRAAMVYEGATWAITFAGTTVRLRDGKGIRDLAVLLDRPEEEVHCLELVGGVDVGGDAGPALDQQARRAYEQRIRDLQEDIAEAHETNDPFRAERAEAELDALVQQLTGAFGLGGRNRATGAASERARSTVTSRIRAAIRQIGDTHPELGRHLQNAVRTGTWCTYRPETKITWDITREERRPTM